MIANNKTRKLKLRAELKRMIYTLRAEYAPQKMILFGSLASGRVKETSDIDLVIIKETNKKFTDRIGEVIGICQPKMAADLIVYTPKEFLNLQKSEDFIKREIIDKGKVLYEKQ